MRSHDRALYYSASRGKKFKPAPVMPVQLVTVLLYFSLTSFPLNLLISIGCLLRNGYFKKLCLLVVFWRLFDFNNFS